MAEHQMLEVDTGLDDIAEFLCDVCGYRIRVDLATGDIDTINRGDRAATHAGGISLVGKLDMVETTPEPMDRLDDIKDSISRLDFGEL